MNKHFSKFTLKKTKELTLVFLFVKNEKVLLGKHNNLANLCKIS